MVCFSRKAVQLAVWAIDGGVTVMGRDGSVGMVWWPLAAFWRADDVAGGHECVCFSMCDDDGCDVSQSFHFAFRGQRVAVLRFKLFQDEVGGSGASVGGCGGDVGVT